MIENPAVSGSKAVTRNERERSIRSLAREQHGIVTRAQLLALGLTRRAVDYRVEVHRLHVRFRGVYRLASLPESLCRYESKSAVVLACGDGAVLSHGSAGTVWTFWSQPSREGREEVSVVGRRPRPGPTVRVYSFGRLDDDERTVKERIPITTPARTLMDLAGSVSPHELERAVAAAYRQGIVKEKEITRLLERYPGRPGTPVLREILSLPGGPAFTRSRAEALFLERIREARLPRPLVNVMLEGYQVDFLWRRERVVVEVDGFKYHSSQEAFEADRQRDIDLMAAGYRVVRITWNQLTRKWPETLVKLTRMLDHAEGR